MRRVQFEIARPPRRATAWILGGHLISSMAVGTCASVGLCWMAAWDEYLPSPQGLAQYRFVHDPAYIGVGESGEGRPRPLKWWTALTPRSWHVGPRVWADRDIEAEHAANPQISVEAKDDEGGLWCVVWRAGPGLSDSFSIRRFVFVASPHGGVDGLERATLNNHLDFGGDVRTREGLPSGLPVGLVGRGTPSSARFYTETEAEWESVRLPRWALLRGETPERAVWLYLRPGEARPAATELGSAGGVATEEVRAYGWPIRCLVVRGWREDLEWHDGADRFHADDTTRWWSDGLWAAPPIRWADGKQLNLPATGLPWRPLWLPFLANSLILGVPLTLAGLGVSHAARWGFAKVRRRRNRCPRCSYPRTGLARGAACPECGGLT